MASVLESFDVEIPHLRFSKWQERKIRGKLDIHGENAHKTIIDRKTFERVHQKKGNIEKQKEERKIVSSSSGMQWR